LKKFVYILMALILAGCFQVKTTVQVKKDGSGTLTQKVLMSTEFMQSMQQMAQSFDANDEKDDIFFDEEELKAEASQYGDMVRFVSARKLEEGSMSGYEAVYEFDNIEKLTISESPEEKLMGQEPGEIINFQFSKGNPARLNIIMPNDELREDEEFNEDDVIAEDYEDSTEITEKEREMLQQMYKNMKVEMEIVFDGKIVNTNSSFQSGNKICLLQMDFEKLMEDPQTLKYLAAHKEQDPAAIKSTMANIPGVKVETAPEIFVEFK
jgi:hypothetical protein